jgi:hypothetical protein
MTLKYDNKYDNEKQTIYFQKDYVLIRIGSMYEKIFLYNEIREVFFNMDEYGYYFRIIAQDQYTFDYKFNTKFRIDNEIFLIEKVKNREISLLPNFGIDGDSYGVGNGIWKYCKMKKKYVLTITRIKKPNPAKRVFSNTKFFAVNYGIMNRHFYKRIDDNFKKFDLKKELLLSHDNGEEIEFNAIEESHKGLEGQSVNWGVQGIFILDKSLTFGQGYAVTSAVFPIHYKKSIAGDISINFFYSFDEEEIKKKIIELLSPSYFSETYG